MEATETSRDGNPRMINKKGGILSSFFYCLPGILQTILWRRVRTGLRDRYYRDIRSEKEKRARGRIFVVVFCGDFMKSRPGRHSCPLALGRGSPRVCNDPEPQGRVYSARLSGVAR